MKKTKRTLAELRGLLLAAVDPDDPEAIFSELARECRLKAAWEPAELTQAQVTRVCNYLEARS